MAGAIFDWRMGSKPWKEVGPPDPVSNRVGLSVESEAVQRPASKTCLAFMLLLVSSIAFVMACGGGGSPAGTATTPQPANPSITKDVVIGCRTLGVAWAPFNHEMTSFRLDPATGFVASSSISARTGNHCAAIALTGDLLFLSSGTGVPPHNVPPTPNFGSIESYRVNRSSGTVSPLGLAFAQTVDAPPLDLTIDAAGQNLYFAVQGFYVTTPDLFATTINQQSGTLTILQTLFSEGLESLPAGMVVSPDGHFLFRRSYTFVASTTLEEWIEVYARDASGHLTLQPALRYTRSLPATFSSFPGGSFWISADGKFLFDCKDGTRVFSVDTSTGALTLVSTTPGATGTAYPDPKGEFVIYLDRDSQTLSVYRIDTNPQRVSLVRSSAFTDPDAVPGGFSASGTLFLIHVSHFSGGVYDFRTSVYRFSRPSGSLDGVTALDPGVSGWANSLESFVTFTSQ